MLATAANAVYLSPNGRGQALVYPYYTAQSVGADAFNTYISVFNHSSKAKIVRVRFLEGRDARDVLTFDLYLAPDDMWTAAVVPATPDSLAPAHLVTADASCTIPPIPQGGVDFRPFAYSGSSADGAGDGSDRTREGFVEMIEMGDLPASTLAGFPCATLINTAPASLLTAPGGTIAGSLTLINVATGRDFSVNADALANLTTQPIYRALAASTPVDFNLPEIDAVSHVIANGNYYRSVWSRPVDAVSAVLMRSSWAGDVVLDSATRSQTDIVAVFPTKASYVLTNNNAPPFSRPFQWLPACSTSSTAGEPVTVSLYNREGVQILPATSSFPEPPPSPPSTLCPAASVTSIVSNNPGGNTSRVLGSVNLGLGFTPLATPSSVQNGWISFAPSSGVSMTSLPSSIRMNIATGDVTTGPHTYRGLPMTGFWVRTFDNGTLSCNGIACQGNYGGAFPLTYKRSISP